MSVIPHERRRERVDGGGVAPLYVLWHLSRHHDLAVNRVLRGQTELVEAWADRVGLADGLWRGLAEAEDSEVVELLDPEVVDGYASAVLDATIAWLDTAELGDLRAVPDSDAALAAGGVPEERFDWLYAVWSGKPRAFFLSWQAVGHGYNHLGELISIRNRMGLSPF